MQWVAIWEKQAGISCWHALRGAAFRERYCPGVAARWPYPALRRCNPFGIGTGGGTYITPTVIPTHTVIPAQAGTQWSAKRDQNNDSYQVLTPHRHAHAGGYPAR